MKHRSTMRAPPRRCGQLTVSATVKSPQALFGRWSTERTDRPSPMCRFMTPSRLLKLAEVGGHVVFRLGGAVDVDGLHDGLGAAAATGDRARGAAGLGEVGLATAFRAAPTPARPSSSPPTPPHPHPHTPHPHHPTAAPALHPQRRTPPLPPTSTPPSSTDECIQARRTPGCPPAGRQRCTPDGGAPAGPTSWSNLRALRRRPIPASPPQATPHPAHTPSPAHTRPVPAPTDRLPTDPAPTSRPRPHRPNPAITHLQVSLRGTCGCRGPIRRSHEPGQGRRVGTTTPRP